MPLTPGPHGVILVHGMGDTKRGYLLADFSKGVFETLFESKVETDTGYAYPTITIVSNLTDKNLIDKPPSLTLKITEPETPKILHPSSTEWICMEAYWDDAFPSPNPSQVLWWGLGKNLGKQMISLRRMLSDPDNIKYASSADETMEPTDNTPKIEKYEGKERRAEYRTRVGLATIIFWGPVTVVSYALLAVLWILHLPFVKVISKQIKPIDIAVTLVGKIDPFLATSLGDVERYTNEEVWSANARRRVEECVISMLKDDRIEDITIVAHSLGTVVTYDALTEGGEVSKIVKEREQSGKKRKKISFVSVGAGINRVFGLIEDSSNKCKYRKKIKEMEYCGLDKQPLKGAHCVNIEECKFRENGNCRLDKKPCNIIEECKFREKKCCERIKSSLASSITQCDTESPEDKFFWLDIFARQDPVPTDFIQRRIIEKAGVKGNQFESRKVVNTDTIFSDHTSYWNNQELVMPRIISVINGRFKDYPWEKVSVNHDKYNKRFNIARNAILGQGVVLAMAAWAGIAFILYKTGYLFKDIDTWWTNLLFAILAVAAVIVIAMVVIGFRKDRRKQELSRYHWPS